MQRVLSRILPIVKNGTGQREFPDHGNFLIFAITLWCSCASADRVRIGRADKDLNSGGGCPKT
ncbi:hypothetical protein, partial [Klebsiella pneumoniae]|uniref:hypothetical protein n=1 Tax=Klebsiella pneumoniae TaxID=573 RepID=UPI001954734D